MIDSAPSICGSPPPRNACLRQRPRAQWAPEGLWETLLIDNCLLERQRGGGRLSRGSGKKGASQRKEGWLLRGSNGGERWVTGGKGGENKREVGGLGRWSGCFSPSEIEDGIAAINSSLSALPLPSVLFPSHLGLLILPSHFHQRHTTHQCIAPLCKGDKITTEGRRGINKEEKWDQAEAWGFCGEWE